MAGALAVQEPTSLAAVDQTCNTIEQWAEECDSVPELRDASNKLAAIDEYLSRTSTEGRARVAAAMRRLEVRIGGLLGPAQVGGINQHNREEVDRAQPPLNRRQRYEFRHMADHPEVVEEVVRSSTDENPASRRKVLAEVKRRTAGTTKVGRGYTGARQARVEQIRSLAAEGYRAEQIATQTGTQVGYVRKLANEEGIALADAVIGRPRRVDPNRVVAETVAALEGAALGIELLEGQMGHLDRIQVEGWATSLSDSLRSLNRLAKQLKEMAHG